MIDSSESNAWNDAVQEWEIYDVEEDEHNSSSCICGKENIRYLFTIKNMKNDKILFPIGSSCIKKFNRNDLNEITSVNERLFKLFHAVKENKFISLDSDYFSRKLLRYLFDQNAFKPNKYNNYNAKNDYEFILKMFNQRREPSDKQKSKIKAIIVTSIKPFLERRLSDKVVRRKNI
ncbi:hypothetical protein [Staphylococcus muscae]|uniref:Uncharacterized protein n=2 Tax=Staphylococcus muscae TaxID=1294 RepID=A0A240BRQ6_9STAP|nr:hypothetical protein [Staphylococcus muscae]GGA82368.1 hypothetical protein GCM10007183_03220 [Staphylococcus muscae]SNV98394.1 Uncharacterised protein [Staphylococcus muscae]